MATFYSDTMSSNQLTSTWDSQFRADQSLRGSRLRIASGNWTNGSDTSTVDASAVIVAYILRDTDRVWDLFAYGNGEEDDSITVNVGVYQWSSQTGLGAAADADEFATALTIGQTAATSVSVFDEAGVTGRRRGQTLAELTGVTCAGNEWAVCLVTSGAIDQADYEIGSYCYYTAGD